MTELPPPSETRTSKRSDAQAPSALLRLLPWVLAGGGVLFGLAGFTVAALVLARRETPRPVPPRPVLTARAAPPRAAASAPRPVLANWQEKLFAKSCEVPCRGGSACPVTADNAGTSNCPRGKQYCAKCTAPITCIPGTAQANLARGEIWQLHLSMIYEKRHGRRVHNPCGSQSNLWLCVKGSGGGNWECASQADACRNAGGAAQGILIKSDDLIEDGLDVQIRAGGREGRIVAQRLAATYGSLGRAGLCRGFRMGFEDSAAVDMFTYFLMPPQ